MSAITSVDCTVNEGFDTWIKDSNYCAHPVSGRPHCIICIACTLSASHYSNRVSVALRKNCTVNSRLADTSLLRITDKIRIPIYSCSTENDSRY